MYPTIFCHFYFLRTQNKYLVRKSIYNEAEGFVWLVLNPLSAKKVQSESDYISARASPSSFILSFIPLLLFNFNHLWFVFQTCPTLGT